MVLKPHKCKALCIYREECPLEECEYNGPVAPEESAAYGEYESRIKGYQMELDLLKKTIGRGVSKDPRYKELLRKLHYWRNNTPETREKRAAYERRRKRRKALQSV